MFVGIAAGVVGVSALAAVAGIAQMAFPAGATFSAWLLPVAWAIGAAIGAAVGFLWPVQTLAEAARIDRQRGAKERLATAVELARSDRADEPVARACYRQAVAAVGPVRALDGEIIAASRRWLAGAALAALLAVTINALAYEITRPALAALTGAQREALAGAFRDQVAVVGADEVRRALADAAIYIEADDEGAFQEAIVELRRRGFRPVELTPEAVRAAGMLMRSEQVTSSDPGSTPTPADGNADDRAGPWTNVYHPAYTPEGGSDEPGAPGEAVATSFEEAWSAARLRAGKALRRGDVPAEYREIVRRYFATE